MRLLVFFKVCAACLKVDGDGSSTISGEQVGALADGEGRLVLFKLSLRICFNSNVLGVSQTLWP